MLLSRLRHQACYLPVLALIICWGLSTLTRLGLTLYYWPQLNHSLGEMASLFLNGAVGDLLFATALAGFFLVFTALTHTQKTAFGLFNAKRLLAVFFLSAFLLFVMISEFIFWNEFSARFNFVAVDYLIYTNEVLGNIRESYPLPVILGGLCAGAALMTKITSRYWAVEPGKSLGIARRIGLSALGALAFYFIGTMSLNYSGRANSLNQYNQEVTRNGPASFFLAARENELDFKRYYAILPDARYQALAPEWPNQTKAATTTHPLNPQHIVLIEIESMSASFMAAYGNQTHITPYLDDLLKESLWFTNMYATGTRTVRGLEGMSAALPPLPGQSIVRRSNNENLYTLGSMLQKKSYEPMFMYGGYGMFDNMNAYFRGNGYAIRDRSDFSEANNAFATIWGVADELLFNEAIDQLDQDSAKGVKRFIHIMTTSNHRPYTYPDGRIDIPSKTGRDGAVKYTDWAIHHFLQEAKNKPWFDNTVFVIVADHNASVAGKQSLPPNKYLIPALIYAPKLLKPEHVDMMSSQIDLTPTLLAMLGIDTGGVFFGEDLLDEHAVPRAYLVNYQELGYLTPAADGLRHLTIMGPMQRVENYSVSHDGELSKVLGDRLQTDKAIAFFGRVNEVYTSGEYRQK